MVTLKDLDNGLIIFTDSYCFEIYTMDQDQNLQYLRDYECDSTAIPHMAERIMGIISKAFPEMELGDWRSWPISFTDSRKNYIGLVVHVKTIYKGTLESWYDKRRATSDDIKLAVRIGYKSEQCAIGTICRIFGIDDIWQYIFQMYPYYIPHFESSTERENVRIEYTEKTLCVLLPECEESLTNNKFMVIKYNTHEGVTILGYRESFESAVQLATTNASLPNSLWDVIYDENAYCTNPVVEWRSKIRNFSDFCMDCIQIYKTHIVDGADSPTNKLKLEYLPTVLETRKIDALYIYEKLSDEYDHKFKYLGKYRHENVQFDVEIGKIVDIVLKKHPNKDPNSILDSPVTFMPAEINGIAVVVEVDDTEEVNE